MDPASTIAILAIFYASTRRTKAQNLPIQFTSPPSGSSFASGEPVQVRWKGVAALQEPILRVCLRHPVGAKVSTKVTKRRSKHKHKSKDKDKGKGRDKGKSKGKVTDKEAGDSGDAEQDEPVDSDAELSSHENSDDQDEEEAYGSSAKHGKWNDSDAAEATGSRGKGKLHPSSSKAAKTQGKQSKGKHSNFSDADEHEPSSSSGSKQAYQNTKDFKKPSHESADSRPSTAEEAEDTGQSSTSAIGLDPSDDEGSETSTNTSDSIIPSSTRSKSTASASDGEESIKDIPSSITPAEAHAPTTGNCGAAMYPHVQKDGEEFVVYLVVPDIIPASSTQFYIQVDDGLGHKARSATFSLGSVSEQPGDEPPLGGGSVPASQDPNQVQHPLAPGGLANPGVIGASGPPPKLLNGSAGSGVSPPGTVVASHAPPPPTAALAVPLSLVGGVLLVAVFLAYRARKNRQDEQAGRRQLSSMYGGDPRAFCSNATKDVPVPLFMSNSIDEQSRTRSGSDMHPTGRVPTRELPPELSEVPSKYSDQSQGAEDNDGLPRALLPAHIRGTVACDKQLPNPPRPDDDFEEIRIDEHAAETKPAREPQTNSAPDMGKNLYSFHRAFTLRKSKESSSVGRAL